MLAANGKDSTEVQVCTENIKEGTTFMCAICKFKTGNENIFLNHAHIRQNSNIPLWCENCEKCFSNAAVLISHIKEQSCTKEETTYHCGTQACPFESSSAFTFFKHLRYSHVQNFFIFCSQCKKKFTIPQSLISHIQNDCPFRKKNKERDKQVLQSFIPPVQPSTSNSVSNVPIPIQTTIPSKQTPPAISNVTAGSLEALTKMVQAPLISSTIGHSSPKKFAPTSVICSPDSQYPLSDGGISSCSSKKTVLAKASSSSSVSQANEKALSENFACSCCTFSTTLETELEDHYIDSHKHSKRNSCKVCRVNFKSCSLFIKHFSVQHKGKIAKSSRRQYANSSDSDDPSWRPKEAAVHSQPVRQTARRYSDDPSWQPKETGLRSKPVRHSVRSVKKVIGEVKDYDTDDDHEDNSQDDDTDHERQEDNENHKKVEDDKEKDENHKKVEKVDEKEDMVHQQVEEEDEEEDENHQQVEKEDENHQQVEKEDENHQQVEEEDEEEDENHQQVEEDENQQQVEEEDEEEDENQQQLEDEEEDENHQQVEDEEEDENHQQVEEEEDDDDNHLQMEEEDEEEDENHLQMEEEDEEEDENHPQVEEEEEDKNHQQVEGEDEEEDDNHNQVKEEDQEEDENHEQVEEDENHKPVVEDENREQLENENHEQVEDENHEQEEDENCDQNVDENHERNNDENHEWHDYYQVDEWHDHYQGDNERSDHYQDDNESYGQDYKKSHVQDDEEDRTSLITKGKSFIDQPETNDFSEQFENVEQNSIKFGNPVKTERAAEKTVLIGSPSVDLKNTSMNDLPNQVAINNKEKKQNLDSVPSTVSKKVTKIPKIKRFEELKSPADIASMQSEHKLKHFFKCTVYNCLFTTNNYEFYMEHLNECHKNEKLHCTYCFQEFLDAPNLVEHILQSHSKRIYQCSMCFYRALSRNHVEIHIKNSHVSENAEIYLCNLNLLSKCVIEKKEDATMVSPYPYKCTLGNCKFQSFNSEAFIKHNDVCHKFVSQVCCFYCQSIFLSLKQLVSHYRLHSIDNFQCVYCVHGSTTKEEIHLHQSINHADKTFQMYVRETQKIEETEVEKLDDSCDSPCFDVPVPQRSRVEYPKEVLHLDENFYCRMVSCNRACENFDVYLDHMKNEHCAINILCPYCSAVCETNADFENHMMCHGPNLYACSIKGCQWHSFQKENVMEHMRTIHTFESIINIVRENLGYELVLFKIESKAFSGSKIKTHSYVCPFCYYENTDIKLMKNHIYVEFGYNRFHCRLCKDQVCSRSSVRHHFFVSHSGHDVKCEINNNPGIEFLTKTFLTPDIQNKFMEYLQSNNIGNEDVLGLAPVYECEECHSSFKDIGEWQHHWVSCISKANQPYACNHCTQKFMSLTHLKFHTSKDHVSSSVSYTLKENVFQKQTILRKLQLGRLKFFRSLLIPHLKSKNMYGDKLKLLQFDSKYYKCGHCNFNDPFRINIQRHIIGCHKDKSLIVEKIKNSADVPEDCKDQSSIMDMCEKEYEHDSPFVCSFCDRRLQKLRELEQHVANVHANSVVDSYIYYYFPDPELDYSKKDSELYECAYCSVSQENLFHLQRHCNNLHPEVPFKVLGKSSKKSTVTCNYCHWNFMSHALLRKHCLLRHPNMASKSPKKTDLKRKSSGEYSFESSCKIKSTAKIFFCPCCNFSSELESTMKEHYIMLHNYDNNSCSVCHVKIKNIGSFIKHCHLHGRNKKKKTPIKCSKKSSRSVSMEEKMAFTEKRRQSFPENLHHHDKDFVAGGRESQTRNYVEDSDEDLSIDASLDSFSPTESMIQDSSLSSQSSFYSDRSLNLAKKKVKHLKKKNKDYKWKRLLPKVRKKKSSTPQSSTTSVSDINEMEHEDHPMMVIPETDKLSELSEFDEPRLELSPDQPSSGSIEDPGFSYYGHKPEQVDLHNMTIRLPCDENFVQIPLIDLFEQFPMSPIVLVEDCAR